MKKTFVMEVTKVKSRTNFTAASKSTEVFPFIVLEYTDVSKSPEVAKGQKLRVTIEKVGKK